MDYTVIFSNRKTLCIEIVPQKGVVVRAPKGFSHSSIEAFLEKKQRWIHQKLEEVSSLASRFPDDPQEICALRKIAKEDLPMRVAHWSNVTGFTYTSVRITGAKTRFGSCSADNRLCFSLYLASYPPELRDYVVLHELCHTVEHNHSKRFWTLVQSYMPDYHRRQNRLRGKE